MKNMKIVKRIFVLTATVLSLLSTPVNAFADSFEGADDWKVTFDGSSIESTFKSDVIADNVYHKLQPGDDVTFHVEISSSANEDTNWYLTNEVLNSLENTRKYAREGGYLYLLKYIDSEGKETILFDSDTIGGEKEQSAGLGLNEATDSLDEWLFLDTLKKGEEGTIVLKIALDGETQGNAYQDTLADIQLNLAVENAVSETKKVHKVKTGDNNALITYSVIALAASAALVIMILLLKRRERYYE